MNKIVIKYFEPSHTFTSADSFHWKVEQGMKKIKRVEHFQDFVDLANAYGKSFVMDYKSFLLIPRGVSQGKYASEKAKLENVQVVIFKRGSDKIFWGKKALTRAVP